MFMFYFQYVQKRGEIMRSRISKTWPCHLKRAVLLSLLSGLFILPSQINAETSGEEYKDHQIAEADWDGAKAEQDFWSGKGIRNGSDYTFNTVFFLFQQSHRCRQCLFLICIYICSATKYA